MTDIRETDRRRRRAGIAVARGWHAVERAAVKRPAVAMAILAGLFFGLLVALAIYEGHKQARGELHTLAVAEHQSCVIQARGLPASRVLTSVMGDVSTLLAEPEPKQPGEPARIAKVTSQLRTDVATYVRIEMRQPLTRHC